MPAVRRQEYEAPEFRALWFSDTPLWRIAEVYGVSPAAILTAALRRGWPHKRVVMRDRS